MTSSSQTIAIFDLDYTLTKRGTWSRFIWSNVAYKPYLWLPLLASTVLEQWKYKSGKVPRGAVKKKMMRWSLTGREKIILEACAAKFAKKEVAFGLRPGAMKALEQHRLRGDYILIASAAVDLVVEPISAQLNADGYVCTLMQWNQYGRLSSEFLSPNCYGAEKLKRVKAYIVAHGLEGLTSIFYTDSYADIEVMRYCDMAIAVNPDAKLIKLAAKEGYEIVDWMAEV